MHKAHPDKLKFVLEAVELPALFEIIEVEVNHDCNLSCSYCPISQFERIEKGQMPLELFEKLLNQLKEAGFAGRMHFHFYNEPTLKKDLELFVRRAKEVLPKLRIDLSTNGTLLSLERFNKLEEAGVDRFTLTKHENIVGWLFDKTYSQLTDAQKQKVGNSGYDELPLDNRGGLLPEVGESGGEKLPCLIPSYLTVVTLDGQVLPCYEDFFQKESMGSIKEKSILEIWNSSKYQNFRNTLKVQNSRKKFDICKDCNNKRIFPNKFNSIFK
ncbi:MAG: radical SAM protein [Halobacteriovoraceae bacterium]|nr:radical SAM protein [Halobacteriovoraceae bacterium]MBT5095827.1 radical SAM protein [Halobacteriovoraceae bacterium]